MAIGVETQGGLPGVEWPEGLDVGELLAAGWRPTPFRQFIIKLHSRCNLACDYCYMYEMADQSWREQPRLMATATIDRVAARIADHARTNGLSRLEVVLHGGEPLLAGPDHIRYTVGAVRSAVDSNVEVAVHLQTNGTLLDSTFLDLFRELEVRVGVSLDGDEEGNDRHRRNAAGKGSYATVVAGLRKLRAPRYRHLYSGLLSTVDIQNDPVRTYEALIRFRPPALDFLLPHANWDTPPPGKPGHPSPTPFGDWLVAAFDRWYDAGGRETRVRLFSDIIRLLCGGVSHSEAVGLAPVALVVVETDGRIEQVDTLKSAYGGAAATPLHVYRDAFDAALLLPAIAARQIGEQGLSAKCQACELRRVCGGGHYVHRHRAGSGFANPSVYCADLIRLITHIRAVVQSDVAALRELTAQRQALQRPS